MHSKWKIWDFSKSREFAFNEDSPSVIAFSSFDPIAFKFVKEKINYNLFSESKLHVISGREVTLSWIEDNYKSLGLFGNNESFLIQHAEEIPAECRDEFFNLDNFILENRFLILNFNKEEKLFKKFLKMDMVETHQIQAPAFWENNNLLSYLCDEMKVLLGYEAKSLILERVPSTILDYHNILSQICINFPGKLNISASDILSLLGDSKIDNFEFATLFGNKKINVFYKKIIDLQCDHNELRGIFYFLQSHLIKVYDPSYLEEKNKHSKYDKQILQQTNLWKKSDLKRAINYFGELEILAKKKDSFLHSKLRKDFLRTIIRY